MNRINPKARVCPTGYYHMLLKHWLCCADRGHKDSLLICKIRRSQSPPYCPKWFYESRWICVWWVSVVKYDWKWSQTAPLCMFFHMCVCVWTLWAALIFRLSGRWGRLERVVSSPLPQTNAFAISPFRGEGGQTRGRRGNMFREQRVNGAWPLPSVVTQSVQIMKRCNQTIITW